MKRYAANIITGCRIAFSILMLTVPVFSFWFYAMYLAGGVTDMIDGTVARRTNSVSAFGSRLDTLADFVFISSALIKILPAVDVPKWSLAWTFVIAMIKIVSAALGLIRSKRILVEHTVMNKITGFLLFLLPLTFGCIEIRYSALGVCSIATAAAIQEARYMRKGIEVR